MNKIVAALGVLAGVLVLLLLGVSAEAKPPAPAPAPQPYTLDQEIIKKTETPQAVGGVPEPTKIVLTCPSGKVVTGGGFDSGSNYLSPNGYDDNWHSPIRRSYPSATDSWTVEFDPDRTSQYPIAEVTGYAVCVAAAAPIG